MKSKQESEERKFEATATKQEGCYSDRMTK